MGKVLFRTNATDLSDDELRLLDVQFDAAVPLRCLRSGRFEETWNQPSHDLDDAALDTTIRRMCDRGVLETEQLFDETFVLLTNRGGELWSDERCPVWDRYATERYNETKSGRYYATVVAASESTCEDFVDLGIPPWDMSNARVRMFAIRRHNLIYWRAFPSQFAAVVMNLEVSYSVDPDWRPALA
jgi:hypothetical protein